MKTHTLHILFLLASWSFISSAIANDSIEKSSNEWSYKVLIENNANPEEVKTHFNQLAEKLLEEKKYDLLLDAILDVGYYYKSKDEYGERIKWFQFALDSLCNQKLEQCLSIRREFAYIYSSIGRYEKANEILKENLELLTHKGYYETISMDNSTVAKNYLRNGDFALSEEYYKRSLEAAKQSKSTFFTILAYNNLGFFFSATNEFEKGEKHYLKGIEILEKESNISHANKSQLALLKGNIGGLYLKNKTRIEQAIQYLHEDIQFNIKEGELELAINAIFELAKYYYENEAFDAAASLLNEGLQNSKNHPDYSEEKIYQLYYMLFKVSLERRDNQNALGFFKKYDSLRSIRNERKENQRSNIEKSLVENIFTVQLENQEQLILLKDKENEVLQEKNKYFFYRLIIGLISFVIIAVVILLYSKKRISLMRVNKELAENQFEVEKLEKDKAQLELKFKNKDLTDFAIDISRKQDVLLDIKNQLSGILNKKPSLEEVYKAIKTVIQYTNNNLIVDEQLKDFQQNVEEVNHQFFDALQKKYPELTQLDIHVCGLIRLGLSNKEIATMRNVSYKAIRMSRYRIRKKLGLSAEVDIVEFLRSIE